MPASAFPLVVAVIAAGIALVTDVRHRRIPNWLTGGALLIGLAGNLWLGGPQGALCSLAGAGLGLAILLPFYVLRTMGAGDVKLLAAVGALLGPQAVISVAVYSALVGGIQSLIILRNQGRLSLTLHQLVVMRVLPARSGAKAPYAVAISSGVCLAAILPPVLTF